jgi:murein DD-endopeptidase MepM/ murein hydrolase activator NlpD
MNRRIPRRYTILISYTGREPIVLAFRPAIALLILLLGGLLPVTLLSGALYAYANRNTQLVQRNVQLAQEANYILQRLEILEEKIGSLQNQRGGLSKDELSALTKDKPRLKIDIEPEIVLSVARDKIPSLLELLHKTDGTSEQAWVRELARPRGKPLGANARLSSPFGLRSNPLGWGYELHQGVDFVSSFGSTVHVTAPGIVEQAGWDSSFGNRVIVNHGYGYRTLYAHLSEVVVAAGEKLDRDQIIGYLGNTGRSSQPHLHYGIYRNGIVVDPKDYLN